MYDLHKQIDEFFNSWVQEQQILYVYSKFTNCNCPSVHLSIPPFVTSFSSLPSAVGNFAYELKRCAGIALRAQPCLA